LLAVACLVLAPISGMSADSQTTVEAVTDRITYNVGDPVQLRIIYASARADGEVHYRFAVRYAGDTKPVADGLTLQGVNGHPENYHLLWKIPPGARAGRYEISLAQVDSTTPPTPEFPTICSFVVHRQLIRIESVEMGQENYTFGDSISCHVRVTNLSDQEFSGLRVEFSERYWPWIVQQTERVGAGITTVADGMTLKPRSGSQVGSPRCIEAPKVEQPGFRQYSAVIWDHARKNVFAIALSPLVFINPPGVRSPRPYPIQYTYPDLKAVNTASYRHFHPEGFSADAIQFETQHTMFATGANAKIRFSISNPSDIAWQQASVEARLLDPQGKELAHQTVIDHLDMNPRGPLLKQEATFSLPSDPPGVYRVAVQIIDAAGHAVAGDQLELGVNPMPRSALIFCAHEDDDGTQMGFIRALVENQIPVHMVYYTSGDAGSCDRYFEHSCGAADALNFGAVRMQESRAAIGHLGVPPENFIFLGLPDGGTGKIWYEHVSANDPYLAVLLATDHSPYEGMFRPNLPYSRDSVVEATEEIIKKFQPQVIFTVHPPAEGHIDHIVNNYFAVKAMQNLLRAGALPPDLELRVDRIFNPREHPSTPYRYEDHEFYVSGDAMALTQEAGWFYQSQGGNKSEGNIRDWKQLRRTEGYRKVLDWKDHEGWNEKE
jgi:LmbE family N-acetylglucosaminyl deacetylase